jgi:hypothetical protein
MELNLATITPPERSRTYGFVDGGELTVKNVCKVGVRPSGDHRLETTDGKKYIVKGRWNYIILDIDEWTF